MVSIRSLVRSLVGAATSLATLSVDWRCGDAKPGSCEGGSADSEAEGEEDASAMFLLLLLQLGESAANREPVVQL